MVDAVAERSVEVSGAKVTTSPALAVGPGDTITAGAGADGDDNQALDAILPEAAQGLPPGAQLALVAGLSAIAVLGAIGVARLVDIMRSESRHA